MGAASSKEPGDRYRLLLVGMTGSGKSSTGNSILGKPVFEAATGWRSITQECSLQSETRDNITFEVMDTPGFRDYGQSSADIATTISKFLAGVSPGPHAVLVVMSASSRYSEDVHSAFTEAKKLLGGKDLVSRIILVFTGGDSLRKDKVDITSAIEKSETLTKIVSDTDERFVVFDNMATGRAQKLQLEKLIEQVRKVSGSDFTYLSSPAQDKIDALIAVKSSHFSKKKGISLDDATLKVRESLVNAKIEDPLLKEAANCIKQEIDQRKMELDTRKCTLL